MPLRVRSTPYRTKIILATGACSGLGRNTALSIGRCGGDVFSPTIAGARTLGPSSRRQATGCRAGASAP
ncbi:MAG: hypothetical protein E5X40_08370 [Mesorhizobium sp.]|nr:hypothetical protein EOA86_00805 [Mesorhizobium sp. M5C.F.Ca.IN.020.32.2.1]RUV92649.1 hypothetical protein EOA88_08385 [Mesorhizobium sp. M5C.F.Ca.IN.020.14.1.1]RWF78767.1 MAG: hypothetical protein EOS26_04120 [Mesorhizobium sp.]RWG50064.1 MAG: hypothetical protein EOQ62_05460 [Mesorhizobium sp.]RWH46166.1 MAG: hypothetical protein EOQ80_17830 [Mesorhizobium sp.]